MPSLSDLDARENQLITFIYNLLNLTKGIIGI